MKEMTDEELKELSELSAEYGDLASGKSGFTPEEQQRRHKEIADRMMTLTWLSPE